MELREKILLATINVFNQKGLKFTMDDIARDISISKKTIYTVFRDKESLFFGMVDYLFDSIKASEEKVLQDSSLDTLSMIKRTLSVMPDGYRNIDLKQLYLLRDKYPKIYAQVERRLETGWESSLNLLQRGIDEGVIRPVNLALVKMMMEATVEQFFQRDILIEHDMNYADALTEVVNILVEGIIAR